MNGIIRLKVFDSICKYLFENKGTSFYIGETWKITGKEEIDFTELFPYKPIITNNGFKLTALKGHTMTTYGDMELISFFIKGGNFSSSYEIGHFMNLGAKILPFFDFQGKHEND